MIKTILVCDMCGRTVESETCFVTDIKGLAHVCLHCGISLCNSPIFSKEAVHVGNTKRILEEVIG